ncbi:lipid-A-disaccharide synthase [Marinicella rhabdoformis]|uniref:lipid-A-disaccharide synthase n=1 Tax=Marinicella rhabdoformis TaxID=2580566 RepID=UPI0012AED53D|nr:lipid-A-disaccharide synthase [Marinicella rhabdoformis]
MTQKVYKIALVAGEASSDLLGADLIEQIQKRPECYEIMAVGGPKIKATGVNVIQDNEDFAVMGLFEVLKDLPKLLRLKKTIVKKIIDYQPDVFIGVDSPDLNFSIAKSLKLHGIKVMHYVSPSVWAWRPGRVQKMKQFIDHVMCLFPFEPEIYRASGMGASFVGHSLAQNIDPEFSKPNNETPLLAILPGSRNREIETLMPLFLRVASQLPNIQLASCNVSKEKQQRCEAMAKEAGVKMLWFDDATELLKQADFALLGSGTVALQAMLCQTPMVVAYKISKITWFIVKSFRMMQLPYYSLPNVLHGGFLVPEVMQKELTEVNLLTTLNHLMTDKDLPKLKARFKQIHLSLLSPSEGASAAQVHQFLESS